MKPAEYDQNIEKYIPKYEEMQEVILETLPFEKDDPIKILELGIGTGNLAYKLLKRFPHAQLVGVDHNKEMLKLATQKLQSFSPRFALAEEDVGNISFESHQYNVVVSLLSIHHLTDPQKRGLFKKVYLALKPKGIFINGDFVIFESDIVNIKSAEMEKEFMLSRGVEEEGLLTSGGKVYAEDDIPATVENQLKWLKKAGFDETGCVWRYFNYAICLGFR